MKGAIFSRHWFRYNKALFAILQDKCERETKFGKIANILLLLLFNVVKALKYGRKIYQIRLRDPLRRSWGMIYRRPSSSVGEVAVWPWDRPIPTGLTQLCRSNRIVIVAELSIPQCKRYRVEQKVEALVDLGYEVDVISFTDADAVFNALPFARLAIFYRTPHWPMVKLMLAECRRTGIPTVYDIDDLVFDVEEYKTHPVLGQLPAAEVAQLLSGAESYRDCLAACQFAIASTPDLAVWLGKYCGGQVFVLENALDALSLSLVPYAEGHRNVADKEQILIGYGSGTKSHDADFALVAPALKRIFAEYPQVRLVLHGYLTLPIGLEPYSSQIQRVGMLPAREYLQSVADFDINLAPLVSSSFNDAKSNIKFLEAAVLGVPTVASASAAFRGAIVDGDNGYLAENDDTWYLKLRALVEDRSLRVGIGQRAKATALARYSPSRTSQFMREILDGIFPLEQVEQEKTGHKNRVMLVNCHYAPFSFGGATLVVEHMARALAQKNTDVAVFTLNYLDYPEWRIVKYEDQGALVYSVTKRPVAKEAELGKPELATIFARALQEFRPEVVHFHAIQGMGYGLLKIAKDLGCKVVVTAHDDWWFCKRQFRMNGDGVFCGFERVDLRSCGNCTGDLSGTLSRFRQMQSALSDANLVLTPSQYQQQIFRANFPVGPRIKVNKNGIVMPQNSERPAPNEPTGPLRFAFIGGIEAKYKGYEFIKNAFESLNESNYEIKLVDLQQKLGHGKRQHHDWKVRGRVNIVAPFSPETMDEFYQNIDVLLAPTQGPESFGLAVREAAARGVYVVASNCGGVPEDLKGLSNCLLLDLGDLEGLKSALRKMIRDPKSLPHNSRAVFTDIDSQVEDLAHWYDKVLNQHGDKLSETSL